MQDDGDAGPSFQSLSFERVLRALLRSALVEDRALDDAPSWCMCLRAQKCSEQGAKTKLRESKLVSWTYPFFLAGNPVIRLKV